MLLSSNQVLRYVNALAVTADGLSINNIEPAEGASIDNILNIFAAEAWPQMDQAFDIIDCSEMKDNFLLIKQ